MDTLVFRAKITTSATGGGAALPKHIESIIDKVVVEINGQTLGSCSTLNHVYNLILQYQNGADLKVKRTPYQVGGDVTTNPASVTDKPIAIHSLLGFCSSVQPSIIDTALLGNVRIHLYLAPATTLTIAPGATSATYTLNSCYYMIDTIAIDDQVFYNLHNEFLLSGGVYSYPFTSLYTALFSVSSQTQSSRFSINTGSLDMLSACFLPNHGVQGTLNSNIASSEYFRKDGYNVDSWQWEVNGVSIPQFQADKADTLPLALNALNLSQDTLGGFDSLITSDTTYRSNFFAPVTRLNHNCSEDERMVSGISTLGNSANVVFKSTAASSTTFSGQLLLVAWTTSILRVSAGRSISIVS
jgi:hypothetical protein